VCSVKGGGEKGSKCIEKEEILRVRKGKASSPKTNSVTHREGAPKSIGVRRQVASNKGGKGRGGTGGGKKIPLKLWIVVETNRLKRRAKEP